MREFVIIMEEQFIEMENYCNVIDEIINWYGDILYEGFDKVFFFYVLIVLLMM